MRIKMTTETFMDLPDGATVEGTEEIHLADGTVLVPALALWEAASDITESTQPGYGTRWGITGVDYGVCLMEEVPAGEGRE